MSTKKTHSSLPLVPHMVYIKHKTFISSCVKVILMVIAASCSPVKKLAVGVDVLDILKKSDVFADQHTGFGLYDLGKEQYITTYNAQLRFTPASNTKLLTMYATMLSFQDSIPAVLYHDTDSGFYLQPVGDPTFLLEDFDHQPIYDLMAARDTISIVMPDPLDRYGAGWAWDDYPYSFQVERSWWPIYGNRIRIKREDSTLTIQPRYLKEFVEVTKGEKRRFSREPRYNAFSVMVEDDTSKFDRSIPFDYSQELFLSLLADTLKNTHVRFAEGPLVSADTLFSQHVDTVLSRMMKPSDNFLAEQLLILSAWQNGYQDVGDYLDTLQNDQLKSFGKIVWVDGSGLSRYNLISPDFQIKLLKDAYERFGWERLQTILATGGEGTLEELYLSNDPFIYAKTGTLSNNHNLSGFLLTKSGKTLIFSIMNNHYIRPTIEVKKAMESLLLQIREA